MKLVISKLQTISNIPERTDVPDYDQNIRKATLGVIIN
jgi:hypothetical protein